MSYSFRAEAPDRPRTVAARDARWPALLRLDVVAEMQLHLRRQQIAVYRPSKRAAEPVDATKALGCQKSVRPVGLAACSAWAVAGCHL